MRKNQIHLCLIVVGCLGMMVSSCGQGGGGGGPLKAPAVKMALKAPKDTPNKTARLKNNEGISHLIQEHWEKSNDFFYEALEADPNLAVAHFNLGLSLDELGKHAKATEHFKKALELAANEPKIAENEILKKHLEGG